MFSLNKAKNKFSTIIPLTISTPPLAGDLHIHGRNELRYAYFKILLINPRQSRLVIAKVY